MGLELDGNGFQVKVTNVKSFGQDNSKEHISKINEYWPNRNISHLTKCHFSTNNSVFLRASPHTWEFFNLFIGVEVGDINFN